MVALVVVLAGGADHLFIHEGVAGDGGFCAVNAEVAAFLERPDDIRRSDSHGGHGVFGLRLVLFLVNEDDLFEQIFFVVMLDERHDEGLLCMGREVAGNDAGAVAGMPVLPKTQVRTGEVLALNNLPVVLLGGGAEGVGEAVQAGFGVGAGGDCEDGCDEDPFREAHGTSFTPGGGLGDTSFGGVAPSP